VGRVILNDALPAGMPFINGLLKKKGIGQLVNYCNQNLGLEVTVGMLDRIKNWAPICHALRAVGRPGRHGDSRQQVHGGARADLKVVEVQKQYMDGAITNGERSNKVIQMWSAVTDKVADEMFGNMKRADEEGAMIDLHHGRLWRARIEAADSQLSGMRGLMAKPSGEVIETPITANFREGLTVLEYFISTHGARKDWPTRR